MDLNDRLKDASDRADKVAAEEMEVYKKRVAENIELGYDPADAQAEGVMLAILGLCIRYETRIACITQS